MMKILLFSLTVLFSFVTISCLKVEKLTYNDFYSYLSEEKLDGTVIKKEKVTWRHWEVNILPDNTARSGDYKTTDREFDVLVLENNVTALTLLPEYGGRLLSYYYKPTKHEQLYQNPVGTPFGIGAGSFYFDWLMVYGGLFPTFPEPEHGKTWFMPWEYQIVEDSSERVAVEMRFSDTQTYTQGIPQRFNGKATNLTCVVTYSLEKGSSVARMDVKLLNEQNEAIPYEYWTCITFAPGSTPGDTKTTAGAKIVSSQDKLRADWSPNGWLPADAIRPFSDYDELIEWKDMGILYAHPYMTSNWYGVLNSDNDEAFLRVGDNSITQGLKLWTWGYEQSKEISEVMSFTTGARPYIELWSGVSKKFFEKQLIAANSQLAWSEYYFPTVSLPSISYANEHGAISVETTEGQCNISLFMVRPDRSYKISVFSDEKEVFAEKFVQKADSASSFEFNSSSISNFYVVVTFENDNADVTSEDQSALLSYHVKN